MAVLEKIRVKFGLVISIIIALALLSFIIDPNTLGSAINSMSSKYDVGQIAGKNISYQDYQADVDRYTAINELLSGTVRDEETQRQIRNAAWQELLDKYMFVKNAREAGITVGQDEMVALMGGEIAAPSLVQNPLFMDETGVFVLPPLLPRAPAFWVFLAQFLGVGDVADRSVEPYIEHFAVGTFDRDGDAPVEVACHSSRLQVHIEP